MKSMNQYFGIYYNDISYRVPKSPEEEDALFVGRHSGHAASTTKQASAPSDGFPEVKWAHRL